METDPNLSSCHYTEVFTQSTHGLPKSLPEETHSWGDSEPGMKEAHTSSTATQQISEVAQLVGTVEEVEPQIRFSKWDFQGPVNNIKTYAY